MKQIYRFRNSKQIAWILTGILFFILSGTTLKAQCPVVADFSYSIGNCTEVTFTSNATVNPPGLIDTYRWEFGDGGVSVVDNPVYDYLVSGSYNVLFIVTDTSGCADTAIQQVVLSPAPVAAFTSSFTSCRALAVINPFNDPTYTYFWDFGDGATSTAHTPPDHVYASVVTETTYNVSFTVTNALGCSSTDTQQVTIYPDISASYTFSPDGACSSDTVTFDASASTGVQTYSWFFSDGSATVNTANSEVSHVFAAYNDAICTAGETFNTFLIVSNTNNCQASTSQVVSTLRRPQPSLQDLDLIFPWSNCNNNPTPGNPDYTLSVNNTTNFMTCVDSMNIEWGDGVTTFGLNDLSFPVSHTYTSINQFSLRVIAFTNGCSGDTTYLVSNQSVPASAGVVVGASTVDCAPHDYTFQLTNYAANSNGTTYTWDFGDGSPQVVWVQPDPFTVDTIVHTYTTSACAITVPQTPDYTVTLVVSNLCASRTTTVDGIHIYTAPEIRIDFVNSVDTVCINQPVCIRNLSDPGFGGLNTCDSTGSFLVNFGDGAGFVASPLYDTVCSLPYTVPGSYKVVMEGENSANFCGAVRDSSYVLVVGTHAEFTADTACLGNATQFTDLSYCYSDADYTPDPGLVPSAWYWDFGDPASGTNTSTVQNPTHTYSTSGRFAVTLIVTGPFGCDSTVVDTVYVDDIQIDSAFVTNVSCNNLNNGTIQVYSSLGVGIHTYVLTPGGISNTTGYYDNLSEGAYTVTVTDENNCSVFNDTLTIINPDAIAIFVDSYTDITCNGFNDGTIQVSATGGTGTLTFTLNPGGISNTTGLFENLTGGVYTVSVTDGNGCPPEITPDITIVDPPALDFTSVVGTNITCFNDNDGVITAIATGGTGTITYTLNPVSISNTTGVFNNLSSGTYSVTITDVNNCTLTSPDVEIINPTAISILSTQVVDVTCNGAGDGSITVTAVGGTGTLTYTLNPGAVVNTTGIFGSLNGGNYDVTISDDNGCSINTGTLSIIDPAALGVFIDSYSDITCNGLNDGFIQASASGGTGIYTFTLNPLGFTNTTGLFQNLINGTYSISVTDANNCPVATSMDITIVNPPALVFNSIVETDITCNDANNGEISATASGGSGTITYTLNPGAVSNTTGLFTGLTGGTYTVTIADDNNCSLSSPDIVIDNPSAIIITNATFVNVTCNGGNDGSITITASGGVGTLNYTLNPGAITNTTGQFPGLSGGTYVVTIDDQNGCTINTGNITIVDPGLITISDEQATDISCNNLDDGTITITVAGGTAPFTYTLTPGPIVNNTGVFNGLASGIYTVLVEDANGCPSDVSSPITINNPPLLEITAEAKTDITCFNDNDGTVTVAAQGGTGTLTYTLNPGGIQNTTGSFTDLPGNNYTVTVEDANLCSVTSNILTVVNPIEITIQTQSATQITCRDDNDGTITVVSAGGTGVLTYTLNPGGITQNNGFFNNLSAGAYTVTAEDANLCSITSNPLVINNPEFISIVTETSTDITCRDANDGIVNVTATGGTGNLHFTLMPNNVTQINNGTFIGLGAGTYYLEVTDDNGCPIATSINLDIVNPPALVITSEASTNNTCFGCNDGTITVTATGGTGTLLYTLNPGGIANGTGAFINLAPGSYVVTVTDDNGCSVDSNPLVITQPDELVFTLQVSTDISCNNVNDGTVSVTVTGGVSPYTYTLNPLGIVQNNGDFTGLSAGIYTVTVVDDNGNSIISNNLEVVNPDVVQILSESQTDISCYNANDGVIDVTAGGGTGDLTYTLQPTGTVQVNDGLFTGLAAGTYFVVVNDANGCPSAQSSDLTIVNPAELIIISESFSDITCNNYNNGSITETVTGGTGSLTYFLMPSGIFNNTGLFPNLAAGSYFVRTVDQNGCSIDGSIFTITNPPGITNVIIKTDVTCNGDNDGTITINASGGTGSLEYSLDNGFTFSPISFYDNLAPDTYVVVIRDANGCVTVGQGVVITQPNILSITSFNVTNTSCFGCTDGEAEAVVFGGTAPYTHSWSNGATTNPATGLGAGTYTDTVTDAHGCTTFADVTITQPETMVVTTDSANALCFGTNTGWVSATVTGGTAPYTYSWILLPNPTVIGTNSVLTDIGTGTYQVTVSDFYNNTLTAEVSVGQPDLLTLAFNFSDTVCFGASDGWGEVLPSGGMPGYSYQWDDPASSTTPDISNLAAGIYQVVVTDNNLCEATGQFEILENPEMFVSITVADPVICSGQSTQLTAMPSGGTNPYVSYLWDNAATLDDPTSATPLASPTDTTTYTVTVTDARGCSISGSIVVNVIPSPIANIGYNNPCASNVVYFFDLSLPNGDSIVSYYWDFGDGNFSTNQNPVNYYLPTGTSYLVSLTVVNQNGCSDTQTEIININPTLGADFTVDSVCMGDSTHFFATALSPSNIVEWNWDFGDGNTSLLRNPTHLYQLPGTYNVSITITDNSGCVEFVSHLTEVYTLPNPEFTAQTICLGDSTYFTDLSNDPSSSIISWYWDFGDPGSGVNNTSALSNPTHFYAIAGDYNVSLAVGNQRGCSDTLQQIVTLHPNPTVLFSADTVCFGTATHFTDLSFVNTGEITSWNWDFGDGISSTLENPNHLYAASGKYEVTLVAANISGCSAQYTDSVWVHSLPTADFTFGPFCVNHLGQFFDTSTLGDTNIVSWNWNFGDGFTSTLQDPEHNYLFSGTFNVQLEVVDANGCSDVIFQNVLVNPLPNVDFDYSVANCSNDTTFFTDLSIPNPTPIASWFWDFGDGNTSIEQNPGHYYGIDGTFTATLTITNTDGCENSIQRQIDISAPPVADFSSSAACFGTPVQFTDESQVASASVIDWEWNFGEPISGSANVSFVQNPTHNYSGTGDYLVTLIVTSSDFCYDTIQKIVTIHVGPVGDFVSTNACLGDTTLFTDMSTIGEAPIVSWNWDFGDASGSTDQNPSHLYGNSGQYVASLTVTDTTGCATTVNRLVNVLALPIPQFIYEHACENTMAHFTDYSIGSGSSINSWFWDFGDPLSGANNFSILQNPSHMFTTAGTYSVTLSVTNVNGCQNSDVIDVVVEPGPVADFTFDSACSGNPTHFIDQSFSLGSPITDWYWNFGDGSTSTLPMPVHTFASPGYYNVALSVTIANGCVDQVIHQVFIEEGPIADFSFVGPSCTIDSIHFTDLSTISGISPIISWLWDFGDGNTSTVQNPVHYYTLPGVYQVSLTVGNTNFCNNTITKTVTSGSAPIAEFSFNSNTCDTVHFIDETVIVGANVVSWSWDFGDPLSGSANFSSLQNPTHIYSLPGSYDVQLIVESDEGCADTIVHTLSVNEIIADFEIANDGDCAGGPVQFNDLSSSTGGAITAWSWDFGDPVSGSANVSTDQNPVHTFSGGGTYNVTLVITDQNGCSASITRLATTRVSPTAMFDYVRVLGTSCQSAEIQFTDMSTSNGSAITTWVWNFGDGSPDSVIVAPNSPNAVHTFSNGSYIVSLTVTNADGCTDTYLQTLNVSNPVFTTDFSYTIDSCLTAQFADLSTPPPGYYLVEWYWEFGDDSTSTWTDPGHSYLSGGLYNVTLTVTADSAGYLCTNSITLPVIVPHMPTIYYTWDPEPTCLGDSTHFYGSSGTEITEWYWNFGDGLNDTGQAVSHLYANPGTYDAVLYITDTNLCVNSLVHQVNINPMPDVTMTIDSTPTCAGTTTLFTGGSTANITNWWWDFGDGGISEEQNPQHIYTTGGTYQVTLTATDDAGCS
ncbi:MAG: PKD domain-containing protein, partial [Bacteroidales bacterium]|nr:PKD domain-containing protein [Bacteroidales bacterium]